MADDHGLLARWLLALAASADRRLSRTDLAVLMVILDAINGDSSHVGYGTAWKGLKRIASDSRVDRSSAVRSVGRLSQFGYLIRESGDRTKSNRYRIGRCALAPSRESTPRRSAASTASCDLAPWVGANLSLGVGANSHPDLAYKNPPIEPTHLNPLSGERFAEFYAAYPKKVGRPNAEAIWKRKKLDAHADAILADVVASTATGGRWNNIERKFIKDPERYLKGEHWGDEWDSAQAIPLTGLLPRDERSDDELEAANRASLDRFAGAQA